MGFQTLRRRRDTQSKLFDAFFITNSSNAVRWDGMQSEAPLRAPIKKKQVTVTAVADVQNAPTSTNTTGRSHLGESQHTDADVFKENDWKAFSWEASFTLGLRYLCTPQLQGLFVIWKGGRALEDSELMGIQVAEWERVLPGGLCKWTGCSGAVRQRWDGETDCKSVKSVSLVCTSVEVATD